MSAPFCAAVRHTGAARVATAPRSRSVDTVSRRRVPSGGLLAPSGRRRARLADREADDAREHEGGGAQLQRPESLAQHDAAHTMVMAGFSQPSTATMLRPRSWPR